MISSLAPGSRIIARDEERLVRRVDLTASGAHLLTVTGLSPLVRNREATFIDRVEELDEPIHYRIQFPVMRQYEADTWYDQRGRIIFTNSKGLPGVGLPRAEWNEVRALRSGTVKRTVTDTTLPTGPVEREIIWHAPFSKCDRENDYATVWRKLEEKLFK